MSSESPREDAESGRAAEEFASYLERIEFGEELDFDSFCASRPELTPELRALHTHWRAVRRVLDRLGGATSVARRVEALSGHGVGPPVFREGESRREDPPTLLAKLKEHAAGFGRYRLKGEVGRGGMGVVLRVWDDDLRRNLAMKVVLGKVEAAPGGDTPPVDSRTLGRFLEEAQVTGQLDHPNIVPVHELGLVPDGRAYFTMKLVKGRDLKRIYDLARRGAEGWSLTRALGVLLKVCEAMSYAHSKGVVHRDLKPSNVMVGRFGEVYVMDWGLARILGEEDRKDIRIRPAAPSTEIRALRDRGADANPDSPLYTMDGDVVGTPAYMSPEQASGQIDRIGPPTDVYAVGAMLYELLTGRMPYVTPGARVHNYAILQRAQEGPPAPVAEIAPHAPSEVAAICEKAMRREIGDRYASMEALAEDLRAWLEGRVVRAYESGPIAEFRKWVGRNRAVASTLAALIVVIAASGFLVAWRESVRVVQANERETRIQRLLDERLFAEALDQVDMLFPVRAATVPAMESWRRRVGTLVQRLPVYRAELAELERRLLEEGAGTVRIAPDEHPGHAELLALEAKRADMAPFIQGYEEQFAAGEMEVASWLGILELEVAYLEAAADDLRGRATDHRVWEIRDPERAADHARLAELVARGEALTEPEDGARDQIERRIARAAGLRAETIDAHRQSWDHARRDIRANASYGGLELPEQVGLVPIAADPESGLWEFLHVLSGEMPERGADGRLVVAPETGIVLVLLPGGTFRMGRDAGDDSEGDLEVRGLEGPAHELELAPFFLAKYELTQAQWLRATGRNPSEHFPGQFKSEQMVSQTNPVETVNWDETDEMLARWGLLLPTEAQWEYGARGGTATIVWSGALDSILDLANHADATFAAAFPRSGSTGDDGYALHAPVDALAPNPFGLHHVLGNVREWCRDWYYADYQGVTHRPGDGAFLSGGAAIPVSYRTKTYRGGGFKDKKAFLRVTYRGNRFPNSTDDDQGLRPSLELQFEGGGLDR